MICPVCKRGDGQPGPVCVECLTIAPMRMINIGKCRECGYEWKAPKLGACPRCHSKHTYCEEAYTNGLKRL